MSGSCFEIGGYELRRRFNIDGVSVGAQASTSIGIAISQRLNAGLK